MSPGDWTEVMAGLRVKTRKALSMVPPFSVSALTAETWTLPPALSLPLAVGGAAVSRGGGHKAGLYLRADPGQILALPLSNCVIWRHLLL